MSRIEQMSKMQRDIESGAPQPTGGASFSNDLLNDALALADKREHYCRHAKPCPKCGTEQMQLVDWINDAEWKCRHCKHEWNGI